MNSSPQSLQLTISAFFEMPERAICLAITSTSASERLPAKAQLGIVRKTANIDAGWSFLLEVAAQCISAARKAMLKALSRPRRDVACGSKSVEGRSERGLSCSLSHIAIAVGLSNR